MTQNQPTSLRASRLIWTDRIPSLPRATSSSTPAFGCLHLESARETFCWRTQRFLQHCSVGWSRWKASGRTSQGCHWGAASEPRKRGLSPDSTPKRTPMGTVMELLSKVVPIAMLTFVVSSMLAVGASLNMGQILGPLRNRKLVCLALLANFLLMPLGALVIAKLLRLDQPLGVALLLLGVAAGAPFLPKLAVIAKGNLAFAVGLMVLLMVLTVAYMPLVLPF